MCIVFIHIDTKYINRIEYCDKYTDSYTYLSGWRLAIPIGRHGGPIRRNGLSLVSGLVPSQRADAFRYRRVPNRLRRHFSGGSGIRGTLILTLNPRNLIVLADLTLGRRRCHVRRSTLRWRLKFLLYRSRLLLLFRLLRLGLLQPFHHPWRIVQSRNTTKRTFRHVLRVQHTIPFLLARMLNMRIGEPNRPVRTLHIRIRVRVIVSVSAQSGPYTRSR